MSLATWLAVFYPVAASEATGSDLEAARHSLRKWEGAKPEVLASYSVAREHFRLFDGDSEFRFADYTCALCVRVGADRGEDCDDCIGLRANREQCSGSSVSPWCVFGRAGDPDPMLAWLRKAVVLAEKEAGGEA